jgi:hypothetical protein
MTEQNQTKCAVDPVMDEYIKILSDENPRVVLKQWCNTSHSELLVGLRPSNTMNVPTIESHTALGKILEYPISQYTKEQSLIHYCIFEKVHLVEKDGSLQFVNYVVYIRLDDDDKKELINSDEDVIGYCCNISINNSIAKVSPCSIDIIECQGSKCRQDGTKGIYCTSCYSLPEDDNRIKFITQLLNTDLHFVDIPSELIILIERYYTKCNVDFTLLIKNHLNKTKQKLEQIDYRKTQKYLDDKLEKTRQKVEQKRKDDTIELARINKLFNNNFKVVAKKYFEKN